MPHPAADMQSESMAAAGRRADDSMVGLQRRKYVVTWAGFVMAALVLVISAKVCAKCLHLSCVTTILVFPCNVKFISEPCIPLV
jgi:hypothetical protein